MARDPLRILMVTPRSPLKQGGVERNVLEVSSRLVTGAAHVAVLCADPGGQPIDERRHDGVVIRSVRAWPANRDWYFAPAMWAEIERGDWDVIHVQSYHSLVAPLAMLRALTLRIPYCVTFHGGGHTSRLRNRARRIQLRALRPLLARAARLVTTARFESDLYSRELKLPRERFELIPSGTDLTFSPSASIDRSADGAVLASIGRLERYKGHHRVIAALPYVLESRPDARLLIVGTGPYESALRKRAAELGVGQRVQFTSAPAGDREAMTEILSQVSLVVLMSEFETHPLVALEAAAARRRLLVADRAGLLELAQDGLARAIPLGSSPRDVGRAIIEELGKPPPNVQPKLTTWDECADELLELYRAMARR